MMSEDVSYFFGEGRYITDDEERKWSDSGSTNDTDVSFFDQFVSLIVIPEDAPLTQSQSIYVLDKDAERIRREIVSSIEGNTNSPKHDEDYESDEYTHEERIDAEPIGGEEYERMSRAELIQIIELQNENVQSTEQLLRREEREIKYKEKCMARLAKYLRRVQIELRGAQAQANELKKILREEQEKRKELEKNVARLRRDKLTIKTSLEEKKPKGDKEKSVPVEEPENSGIETTNGGIEPETPNTKRRRKVDERRRKLVKQGSLVSFLSLGIGAVSVISLKQGRS